METKLRRSKAQKTITSHCRLKYMLTSFRPVQYAGICGQKKNSNCVKHSIPKRCQLLRFQLVLLAAFLLKGDLEKAPFCLGE